MLHVFRVKIGVILFKCQRDVEIYGPCITYVMEVLNRYLKIIHVSA